MRLANAFKYQMYTALKSLGIYYGIMLAIRIVLTLADVYIFKTGSSHVSAMEGNTMVFMMFLGVFSFVEDFKFFVQNGYSRKSLMKLYLLQFIACGFLLASLDQINSYIFNQFITYESLSYQIYGAHSFFTGLLWSTFLYISGGVVSFFMTILFLRLSKVQRIVYLLALPMALVMIVPVLDIYVLDGALSTAVWDIFLKAMGFYEGIHMSVSVMSFALITLLFSLLSYLIIRRTPVFMQA